MLHTLVRERLQNKRYLFVSPANKDKSRALGAETQMTFIGLKKRKSVMRVQRGNVIIFFIFETRCGLTMLFCTANLTKFLTSLIQVF